MRPVTQEILQRFTARQLRLAFLTQLWNTKIDFSESMMTGEVKSLEVTFNASPPYFNIRYILRYHTEFFYKCQGNHKSSTGA
jgi:hypothetical protein